MQVASHHLRRNRQIKNYKLVPPPPNGEKQKLSSVRVEVFPTLRKFHKGGRNLPEVRFCIIVSMPIIYQTIYPLWFPNLILNLETTGDSFFSLFLCLVSVCFNMNKGQKKGRSDPSLLCFLSILYLTF